MSVEHQFLRLTKVSTHERHSTMRQLHTGRFGYEEFWLRGLAAAMRRPFYDFYASTQSPSEAEVVARICALYAIEAEIRGSSAEHRQQIRGERSRPIVDELHAWLHEHERRASGASDLARAIRYAIRHWAGLVVFLDDGRVEMDTNVVERAIRPSVLMRKNALFAGSDDGARHWAEAMTLIQTAKLNGVELMAWLTDVLERVVSGRTRAHELHTLLPWNWRERPTASPAAPPPALAANAVIDRPDQVEPLMVRLGAVLPIPVRPTPELQATLQKKNGVCLPADCRVTWVSYAGDQGGIVCKLEGTAETAEALFGFITHLRFDPRLPLAREIATYQKHRVERLRRQ